MFSTEVVCLLCFIHIKKNYICVLEKRKIPVWLDKIPISPEVPSYNKKYVVITKTLVMQRNTASKKTAIRIFSRDLDTSSVTLTKAEQSTISPVVTLTKSSTKRRRKKAKL